MHEWTVYSTIYSFSTKGEVEFVDLTQTVKMAVERSEVMDGLVHVFAPHATGILMLTENDPDLLTDIKDFLERLAPRSSSYEHPSNAHSHLRSLLFPPEKTLQVNEGRVQLGTWQSLLFVETDVHPRKRTITIKVVGET